MTVTGRPLQLTSTEYKLLFELSVNAGRLLDNNQLLWRVWSLRDSGDSQVVRAYSEAPPQQAGGRSGQPDLHLQRAARRLPHGEEPDAGRNDTLTIGALSEQRLPNQLLLMP